MSSDYYMQDIDRWETIAGVEVPIDQWGHYLDWEGISDDKTKALDLTTPYGILAYAVGNSEGDEECDGDWTMLFDFAELPDGRIVLHSVANTESGGYIGDGEYCVCSREEAEAEAQRFVDEAIDCVSLNEVRHDKEGWNQSSGYFARCVAAHVANDGRDVPRILEGEY